MNSLTPITDTFVEEFDIDNGPLNYRAVPEEICKKLEIKYNELLKENTHLKQQLEDLTCAFEVANKNLAAQTKLLDESRI